MRNQTSFRLTTTLLPTDTTAKTTTVINKVDENGDKFYPTFTEETVVLTNDDRTVMETTRAICTDWALTFIKRGLSDDLDPETWEEYEIENRKLTWNPWSLAFITAGAGDILDKDDDIVWTGNQTYTWSATYRWALTTEKWVQYPHFDNVAALEAYAEAFGWMFAVVDSTWELYRYNAVTQEWSVVESSTPTNPEMASTTTIWTVRIATQTEFDNWTDTWSQWEKLVATPSMIQGITPTMELHITDISQTETATGTWVIYIDYVIPKAWFLSYEWYEQIDNGDPLTKFSISTNATYTTANYIDISSNWKYFSGEASFIWLNHHQGLIAVSAWKIRLLYTIQSTDSRWDSVDFDDINTNARRLKLNKFFYFW